MDNLRVSMVQSHIIGDSIDENISYYGDMLSRLAGNTDLAVLPELFTTGMTLKVEEKAESNEGKTISAMKQYAKDYNFALTGSFLASDNGKYYNRAFFITPDGQEYYYDKRHLFRRPAKTAVSHQEQNA
jgi:predicted amidohydrolase